MILKETPSKTKLKVFSMTLCLLLLLQGSVLNSNVSAQVSMSRGQSKGDVATVRTGRQSLQPERRAITALAPVNMQALASQRGLTPKAEVPRELRPIHQPKGDLPGKNPVAIPSGGEAGAQPAAPVSTGVQSPPVSHSFKSDDLQLGSIPPDTMGAVGDNHVVTTTNEKIVIHTRDGRTLSTVTLDDFWATVLLGGSPPNTFDPKILYDRFNDRFIIVTQANAQTLTSATLVAVSQTADPTGNYNRFAIDADAAATATGGKWADFPSIGFNKNWITLQINLFGFGTVSGYQGPAVYVIDKAAAYNNTLSTVSTFEGSFATCLASGDQGAELGCGFSMAPAITEDNTTEPLYLTEDWDSTAGQLRLTRINGTPAAPVLTVGYQFPQSVNSWRFDARIIGTSGGYALQRQQNIYAISGNRVTANDARIQNAVLRNGSLWTVHHVMLPTVATLAGAPASTAANPDNHTAVQWWEIDPTIENDLAGTLPIQRGRIEDPTADNCHNGSGGLRTGVSVPPCPAPQGQFFAFANIAVNQNDDVFIGYTRFSELTLPKTAYSFRAGTDAANTMRDSQTFREGNGNYNIGAGTPFNIRWGDYSASMVDPLNDTDFWTVQEYADFQREIFGPGQFAGVWSTWWGLVKPSATTTTAGNLIISEFRLRGPAGPRDEFIELYNPGSTPLTVTTTDGSDGWGVAFSANGTTITTLAAIPNGTTIPARGHYLVVNNVAAAGIAPFSLNAYGNTEIRPTNGDAMYTPDLADNGGIAIFRTSNPANMNAGTRMDSAGFAGIAAGLFKEGTGIPNITGTPTGQISFARREETGAPLDTSNNATDFLFLNTVNESLGVPSILGAPGPQNFDSPREGNFPKIVVTNIDPGCVGAGAATTACARVRTAAGANPTNAAFGTLLLRRRFINKTGSSVIRLRFRIVDMTTFPAPDGVTADLRALTSLDIPAATLSGGGTTLIRGVTLEEVPTQAIGGGINSTLSAGVITLAAPLPADDSINVEFKLGVMQGGTFRFLVNVEALPGLDAPTNGGPLKPAATKKGTGKSSKLSHP